MPPEKTKKRIKPVIEEVAVDSNPTEQEVIESVSQSPVEDVQEKTESAEAPGENVEVLKESTPQNKMNIKLIVVITIVSAVVAAVVSGGVYVYLSGVESLDEQVEPTPVSTATPTVTPASSPSPEQLDVSSFSVRVLNGSGRIGAAGAGEEIMTEAGFEVESTGNASNYNFRNTVIQVKAGVPVQAVNLAKEALEENDYTVEIGEALPASSEYDIVVTVGSN